MPSGTIYQGSNDTVNWSFTPPTTGAYQGWNQGWDGGNPSGPTFQTTTGQLPVSGLSVGTHNVTLDFFFNGQSQQVSSPSVTVVAQPVAPQVNWTMPSGTVYQGGANDVSWTFTPPSSSSGYMGYTAQFSPGGSATAESGGGGSLSTSQLSTGTYTAVLTFNYGGGNTATVTSPSFTVSGQTYDQYLQSLNPIAWYKFNDPSSSTVAQDSSGHGNNGTYIGYWSKPFISPFRGMSSISSANDDIMYPLFRDASVSTPISWDPNSGTTIEGWFANSNGPIYGTEDIMGNFTNISNIFGYGAAIMYGYHGYYLQFDGASVSNSYQQAGEVFFVLTLSTSGTPCMYINGSSPTCGSVPQRSANLNGNATYPFSIGATSSYGGVALGSYTNVAIFNKVLTGAQIQKQYQLAVAQGA